MSTTIRSWPLEVDLEVCPASQHAIDARRLRSLTAELNDARGVCSTTAEAHGPANLVRVGLTVDAHDLYDALDRASALVRDRASRVGLGPVILVAAHGTGPPAS